MYQLIVFLLILLIKIKIWIYSAAYSTKNIGTKGYVIFNNGLTIQYGYASLTSTTNQTVLILNIEHIGKLILASFFDNMLSDTINKLTPMPYKLDDGQEEVRMTKLTDVTYTGIFWWFVIYCS